MFSQTTEYALRAMVVLSAAPERLSSTTELAGETGVPPNYLAKVLQSLAAADLITGRRGVGGGYRLSRAPSEITLIDVVRAVGKLERIRRCPRGSSATEDGALCRLHGMMDEVVQSAESILDSYTLRDVLASEAHVPSLCGSSLPLAGRRDPGIATPSSNGDGAREGG